MPDNTVPPNPVSTAATDREAMATTVDLLDEAVAIRNRLYYNARPNSADELDANRLGRVLFLIREQVTKPYAPIGYYGITHGVWFGQAPLGSMRGAIHNALLGLWRKTRCPRGIHAFDEVVLSGEHYLSCDACDLVVHIASIEVTHVDGLGMDR